MKNLLERDQAVIWHPYTKLKGALDVIPITQAKGLYVFDEQGNKYMDAVSSWWVNIHGHAHPELAEVIYQQFKTLEHVIFAGFTHAPAVEFAELILKELPQNQAKVFYSDNGSTAVEVALKMAIQYWRNQGQTKRTKILAFEHAYHGDTFGAMSVSGRSLFTEAFDPYLFEVEFIPLPEAHNIDALKQQISLQADQIAAFIYEPLVLGAAGMLMYEAAYLDQLIQHCQSYSICCIADEVMTGFGRTGTLFASLQGQEKPDIMCFSKGISGGAMPMGLTTCSLKIFESFNSEEQWKTLYHGHSFTANPLSCQLAIKSLEILKRPQTLEAIQNITAAHAQFRQEIASHPKVSRIRQCGTILAFDWVNTEQTSYLNQIRDQLYTYFLAQGIILRPLGNVLYILPPYVITPEELNYIYRHIKLALDQI